MESVKRRQGSVVGAFLTEDDDMPWVMGTAAANEVEPELNENEVERERRLRREALKRRRPLGFAPWDRP